MRDPKESHFCFQQRAWGVQALPGRGLVLFLPRPPGHMSTRHGQRMCKRKHPRPIQQQDPPAALGRVRPLGRLLAGSACFPPPPPTRTPGPSSAPRPSRPRGAGHRPPTSQCGCTHIAVGIAVPFPVAGRGHGLSHVQLQLLGSTGLPSLQAPVRAPPGAAQLAGKGTQITHQPAGRQDGREAGSSEDQGHGEASLTLRASAGGEMSLSRWESRASPEAPPCSTPAEAPHTCTQSSRTAYTLVRTVLQGAQRAPVRGGHAAAPSPAAPAHHHPSSLFPSWTVTCRASPGLVRGSPSQCSRH